MFFRLCGSRFSKLKIEFAGDVMVGRLRDVNTARHHSEGV
jgi:hypothetical protein